MQTFSCKRAHVILIRNPILRGAGRTRGMPFFFFFFSFAPQLRGNTAQNEGGGRRGERVAVRMEGYIERDTIGCLWSRRARIHKKLLHASDASSGIHKHTHMQTETHALAYLWFLSGLQPLENLKGALMSALKSGSFILSPTERSLCVVTFSGRLHWGNTYRRAVTLISVLSSWPDHLLVTANHISESMFFSGWQGRCLVECEFGVFVRWLQAAARPLEGFSVIYF